MLLRSDGKYHASASYGKYIRQLNKRFDEMYEPITYFMKKLDYEIRLNSGFYNGLWEELLKVAGQIKKYQEYVDKRSLLKKL